MFKIILPWQIRLVIDTLIIAAPFYYLSKHPTTFVFEYFENKRRIARRRTLQTQNQIFGAKQNPFMTKEQAEKFFAGLGMKYE